VVQKNCPEKDIGAGRKEALIAPVRICERRRLTDICHQGSSICDADWFLISTDRVT
jgi:hypothetical protein